MAREKRRRIALLTEYDGTAFAGWQRQAGQRTVQQTLEEALASLFGVERVVLAGSSRTDAGVHARGHVSHFKAATTIPAERLPLALNGLLPPEVSVLAAADVSDDFHASFTARGKVYVYRIWNGRCRTALERDRTAHVPGPLDRDAMRTALEALAGTHDFRAFRDSGGVNRSTVRTLHRCELSEQGDLIELLFSGDGFLYHMVRILAGTVAAVGQGKISASDLPAILAAGERPRAGKTMPPQGLFLDRVLYDADPFAQRP